MKYKVGDRVRIKSLDWYNRYKDEIGDVLCGEFDFVEEMKKFCSETFTISEDAYTLPEGYIFKDENGNVINATKIVLEKKKKEYPKTFRECQRYLEEDVPPMEEPDSKTHRRRQVHLLEVLLTCRDAYWKIAGEEMGLGKPWKPEFGGESYYHIGVFNYKVDAKRGLHGLTNCTRNTILAFPTEEMRDHFYENFKEFIEQCKELL